MCEWNLNLKYDFRPFEEDKNFPYLLNNFRQNFNTISEITNRSIDKRKKKNQIEY